MRGLILCLVLSVAAYAQTTCVGCAGSGNAGPGAPAGPYGAVQFNHNGTQDGDANVRISNGLLAIGNTEPTNLGLASNSFSVAKDENIYQIFTASANSGHGITVVYGRSYGTNAAPANIADGTLLGAQYWTGFYAGSWGRVASQVAIYGKNETWNTSVPPESISNIGGILQWYVDPTPYTSPGGSTMSLVNDSEWQLISDNNNNLGLHVYGATDGSTSSAELNNGAPVSDGGTTISLDLKNINADDLKGTGSSLVCVSSNGGLFRVGSSCTSALHTPTSSSEACAAGQFADDANFYYVCTSTNTWKRVALSSF